MNNDATPSSLPAVPKSERLKDIDALRGIAAFAVMLFHYTTNYQKLYTHTGTGLPSFEIGRYGVNLFFLISGFVIFMTLEKTKHFLDFCISRFSRLFPAYWLAVILTWSLVSIFGLPGRETTIWQTLINLSMLQYFINVPHVDGVYWTLSLELCFYAIMAWVFFGPLKTKFMYVLWTLLWLSFLKICLLKFGGVEIPHKIRTVFLMDYACYFVGGCVIYKVRNTGFSWQHAATLAACFALAATQETGICRVVVLLMFPALYLAAIGRLYISKVPVLLFMGEISYSLYILHQNLGYIVIRQLEKLGIPDMIAVLVAVATTVCLASACLILVERPARTWIRDTYRKNRAAMVKTWDRFSLKMFLPARIRPNEEG